MELLYAVMDLLYFVFCVGLLISGFAVVIRSTIWVLEKVFGD